ncbi:MAG: DUF3267 domain-containing protein, partial [Candidatus Dormiibacterota bacterium]
ADARGARPGARPPGARPAVRVPRSTRPLAELGDTERLAGIWALLAIALFFVCGILFGALDIALHGDLAVGYLDAIVGLALTIVAHEAMHSLAVLAVGGEPRLAVSLRSLPPFVRATSRGRLTRNGSLLALLAPVVVVDLVGIALLVAPVTAGVGFVIVIANSMGSVPDLWKAFELGRLPSWVQCEERGDRTEVWTPPERDAEAGRLRLPGGFRPPATARLLLDWFLWVIVACAAAALAIRLVAGAGTTLTFWRITFASTQHLASGPTVILNVWATLGLGVVLGTLLDVLILLVWRLLTRGSRQARVVASAGRGQAAA